MNRDLKTLIFFSLCLVTTLSTQAQSEEDDKDAIANNAYGAAAAANAAQESLWSLSSSDMKWTMPEFSSTNGWQAVSVPQTNINVTVNTHQKQYNSAPKKSTGQTIFEKNAASHSAQTDRAVAGMKRLQAWREEAARRAEEERRRKAEEDRRDFEAGYANHKMSTAAYYSNKYAQDSWLHTEGVRRLENVDPLERANIPTEKAKQNIKTKSGSQLADMLKQQTGIEVVIVTVDDSKRKSNVIINSPEARIDLFDNMRTSSEDENQWLTTLTESNPDVRISDKKCYAHNKELLSLGGSIPLDSLNINVLPWSGCIVYMDDSIMYLDSKRGQTLCQPTCSVIDITLCGNRLFGKSKNQIVEIIGNNTIPLCTFSTEDFRIIPDSDTSILIHSNILWISTLLRFNIEKKSYSELARTEIPIRKVVSNGSIVIALIDDFIMRIDSEPKLIYCSTSHINDICMSLEGLLVATNKNMMLLSNQEEACIFAADKATKVFCDYEDIYAITTDNNLIKFNTLTR